MQVFEQTGISATLTVTSTELGYDPAGYTHHMITVSGLASPGSDTFYIEARLPGTTTYGYVAALLPEGQMYLVADYKVDAFRITFSAPPTAAKFSVASVLRVGSDTR